MSAQVNQPTEHHLVLLRHGESIGNAEKRHQGQADYPLTELGREQCRQLGEHWKAAEIHFDRIIASPLKRARETAEILQGYLELEPAFNPLLMERDNGKLAGLTHQEALETLPPPAFVPLYQPIAETGESLWELYLRAGQALNELLAHPPGSTLVVGHGAQFNMMIHAILGLAPEPNFQGPYFRLANTGFSGLVYYPQDGRWDINYHNQLPHLESTG